MRNIHISIITIPMLDQLHLKLMAIISSDGELYDFTIYWRFFTEIYKNVRIFRQRDERIQRSDARFGELKKLWLYCQNLSKRGERI